MSLGPDQLRLLALIHRHGSLTGAAHALGLTPAAVTQQLARAERACETPLVTRGPRGAHLTAAGRCLAGPGRVIDEQVEAAATALLGLRHQLSLRLRIGTFQAAAIHLIPPALTALRHRHPDADISVVDVPSENSLDEVAAGRIDLAVTAFFPTPAPPPSGVALHPLLHDPMAVVMPDEHPLATRPVDLPLRLADLADDAWVTILAGHAAREQFDHACVQAGFTPKIRFQTASYDVAQALVATGYGVALVSRLALTGVRGTVRRDLADPPLYRSIHAITLADTTLTPLVGLFLDLIRDVARDIDTAWAGR